MNDDFSVIEEFNKIVKEYARKTTYLKELRLLLFEKDTQNRLDLNIIIIKLHNMMEDRFDKIIHFYTKPFSKNKDSYPNNMLIKSRVKLTPEQVLDDVVFNLDFLVKKNLIHKAFGLSKSFRELIEKLNGMRNAIAHRYSENDKRFIYHGKNILHDSIALVEFINNYCQCYEEILKIDERLDDFEF